MRRRALLSFVIAALGSALLPLACRDATQVKVILTTNACGSAAGSKAKTSLYVGARGATRSPAPQTEVLGCPGPELGSITLVPGDKDGDVRFEAVMSTDGSDCDASPAKCIVARRIVGYAEHRGLVLPVSLDTKCLGVSCDPASTCYDGSCRPADVVCTGSSCDVAPPPDAGAPDATAEAGPTDGSVDAPLDAPLDAGACALPTRSATHIAGTKTTLYYSIASNRVYSLGPTGTETEYLALGANPIDLLAAGGGEAAVASSKTIYLSGGGTIVSTEVVTGLAVLDVPGPLVGYLAKGVFTNFSVGDSNDAAYIAAGGNKLYIARGPSIIEVPTKSEYVQGANVDRIVATNDRIVWSEGKDVLWGSVLPQARNALTTLPSQPEGFAASGDRVVVAIDIPGPASQKLEEIHFYDTSGKTAPTTLGVVSALAVKAKPVELAVVGSCVYVLHGGVVTAYRVP